MKSVKNIDAYISDFPKDVQASLNSLREVIQAAAPRAEETIKYQMPTFTLDGKNLVYFAAYKKHIGFYPMPSAIVAFKKDLKPYVTSKGAIQFPIDKPLPLALVKKIVKFRVLAQAKLQKNS